MKFLINFFSLLFFQLGVSAIASQMDSCVNNYLTSIEIINMSTDDVPLAKITQYAKDNKFDEKMAAAFNEIIIKKGSEKVIRYSSNQIMRCLNALPNLQHDEKDMCVLDFSLDLVPLTDFAEGKNIEEIKKLYGPREWERIDNLAKMVEKSNATHVIMNISKDLKSCRENNHALPAGL